MPVMRGATVMAVSVIVPVIMSTFIVVVRPRAVIRSAVAGIVIVVIGHYDSNRVGIEIHSIAIIHHYAPRCAKQQYHQQGIGEHALHAKTPGGQVGMKDGAFKTR